MGRWIFLIVLTSLLFSGCTSSENTWKVDSTDNNLTLEVILDDRGMLQYYVYLKDSMVMGPSPLGLVLEEEDLSTGLMFRGSTGTRLVDEAYTLTSGKQLKCHNLANEIILKFESPGGTEIDLVLRAYQEGVAFRYLLPGDQGQEVTVTGEVTGFRIPDGEAWMHPYDQVTGWSPAYETYYKGPMKVGAPAPREMNGWAFPMLFHAAGAWMLVSESGVDANYCGVHLDADCSDGLYRVALPVADEALDLCGNKPVVRLPAEFPWRFVIVSGHPGPVVESNMTTHLARENCLEDTSWIHPGRASWSWWSKEQGGREYNVLKRYVDLAAEMGWEYSLVDAGWSEMTGGDIVQLTGYADEKGIGLLLWYNSGGRGNTRDEAMNSVMYAPEKRQAEFKRIHDMGIRGIKVDFFNSDKQCIIDQYIGILRDAAENRLLVTFHGCTLPRGWRRTYPNLMTMEAIMGQEAYRFNNTYPESSPAHQVISVFTRNVVGPMDFTPVGISSRKFPHQTSTAFELAQAVVFESGITHICDTPESYLTLPGFAVDYLKEVPVTWDETRFVEGYPGDHVVLARRKGDTWYVGCLNGQKRPAGITFVLPFLESESVMKTIMDTSGGEGLEERELQVYPGKEMTIRVMPFGGFVGILRTRS
jgi:alpha-glucosidase